MRTLPLSARPTLAEINWHRDASLRQAQPGADSKSLKGRFKIARPLRKMPPAFGVNGNDDRIGKSARGFDRVVSVHREIERAARLRGACKQQHNLGRKAPGHLRDAVVPYCVAGHVDRWMIVQAEHEPNNIAGER